MNMEFTCQIMVFHHFIESFFLQRGSVLVLFTCNPAVASKKSLFAGW